MVGCRLGCVRSEVDAWQKALELEPPSYVVSADAYPCLASSQARLSTTTHETSCLLPFLRLILVLMIREAYPCKALQVSLPEQDFSQGIPRE
jgi:hypothetical protein